MSESEPTHPPRLYAISEVAKTLGVTTNWLNNRLSRDPAAPRADFIVHTRGVHPMQLWSQGSVNRWCAYHASVDSVNAANRRYIGYSDHNAVNRVGNLVATYKLWWRPACDGGTMWWFSTPQGWWTSIDDGVTWECTGLDVRPSDYHYVCVNGLARPTAGVAAVLRSVIAIRQRIIDNDNNSDEGSVAS